MSARRDALTELAAWVAWFVAGALLVQALIDEIGWASPFPVAALLFVCASNLAWACMAPPRPEGSL